MYTQAHTYTVCWHSPGSIYTHLTLWVVAHIATSRKMYLFNNYKYINYYTIIFKNCFKTQLSSSLPLNYTLWNIKLLFRLTGAHPVLTKLLVHFLPFSCSTLTSIQRKTRTDSATSDNELSSPRGLSINQSPQAVIPKPRLLWFDWLKWSGRPADFS